MRLLTNSQINYLNSRKIKVGKAYSIGLGFSIYGQKDLNSEDMFVCNFNISCEILVEVIAIEKHICQISIPRVNDRFGTFIPMYASLSELEMRPLSEFCFLALILTPFMVLQNLFKWIKSKF